MKESEGPARLVSAANEIEAGIIANALREHGIDAKTVGDFIAGFRAEAPGDVTVYVPADQLEKARKTLADIRRRSADEGD